MNDKDKEWEDYLLNIGVSNLNDEAEISRKLEEVERANPEYQAKLQEALDEFSNTPGSKLESVGKGEVRAWLESLTNEEEIMQTKIDHQKYVADIVLSKLELLDKGCIVAGGAPRDWYLGNEATDIDVYLHDSRSGYIYHDQRIGLLNVLGFEIDSKHEDWTVPELYKSNHYVSHLYNVTYLGEKVQIIFVSQPTFISVIDTFPISISKAWYKGGEVCITDDFDLSIKHKILYKTVDSYEEDNKYLLKIREKFSDYTYVTKEQVVAYKTRAKLKDSVKELLNVDKEVVREMLKEILSEID